MIGAVLGVSLLTLARPASPQSSDDRQPETLTTAAVEALVDPLVRDQLERRRIAGAVVVIVDDGAVILSRGYGYADVATGRAMTDETPVRIGSITKTLTAIAAMQLVESGRLDLDRNVRDYADIDIPASTGRPTTLRRLLTHQTGFEDRRSGIGAESGARPPLGAFLSEHLPPRLDQDDAALAYANVNASLAAYLVERVSGTRFEAYLANRVFGPLGMTSTTAEQPRASVLRARVSSGYVTSDQPPTALSMSDAIIYEIGSTGVTAPGRDMGRLLLALLDPHPGILDRATVGSMMSGQVDLARGKMGLGLYSPVGMNGDPFVGHGGDTGSFHSLLALLPEQRFGLFVSYNSDGVPARISPQQELLDRMASRFFPHESIPAAGTRVAAVPGTYAPARRVDSNVFALRSLAEQLTVRVGNGEISLRPGFLPFGGFALREIVRGLYRGEGFEVSFDRAGGVPVLQIGSPVLRFVRVPWWRRASVVVPVTMLATILALAGVVGWPIAIVRQARDQLDAQARRLRWTTRVALLLDLTALTSAVWLVFWGWPLVALSSPVGTRVAMGMYAAAWMAVLLTPAVAWHACRLWARQQGTTSLRVREHLFVSAHLLLVLVCFQWGIAGTTLAF
jgi:CubicO group peptidase (beta-lactamase class C family)